MKIIPLLVAIPLVVLGAQPQANSATIANCSGVTVRVVTHARDTVPNKIGVVLRDGKHARLQDSGPDTVVKVFEVRLFDVLRLSVTDLEPDAIRSVMNGADGNWSLKHKEQC